jgi:hypothetical protein
MSLRFTSTRIRFLESLRSVHLTAERDGVPLGVLVSRAVIEHLAAAQRLSKDESFTIVVRNKAVLEGAANRAFRRFGSGSTVITIEMTDMTPEGTFPNAPAG